ncbi:hypothetical protein PR048_002717 [Dryococelus australis]|uniref:Uncharacterized protein n=1 Tax=Dryococelus australis TaxID=614101 RepID=A0ABQ9IL28_9NEOP|nr:hypothetical protein PR048_002717 [Dryococelus australis]
MQGQAKQEIPEKTRRQAASSGTIPTCKNQGVARPGIGPVSPWWEASSLTIQPPLEQDSSEKNYVKTLVTPATAFTCPLQSGAFVGSWTMDQIIQ